MDDGEFEWDDAKAANNVRDHGVSFEIARHVFGDAFRLDWLDLSEDYGEDRYATVGLVGEFMFYVAYTMRGERDERTRIISAREATPRERRRYHEENDF